MPHSKAYRDFLDTLHAERRYQFSVIIIWFGAIADLLFFLHDSLFNHQRTIRIWDIVMLLVYFVVVLNYKKMRHQEWVAPFMLAASYVWIFFNCLIYGKDSELELFFITIPVASIFVVGGHKKFTLFLLFFLPIIFLSVLYGGGYQWKPFEVLDSNFLNRTALLAIVLNMVLLFLFARKIWRNQLQTTEILLEKNEEILIINSELLRINELQQKDNHFLDQRIDEVVTELRKKEREVTFQLIQNEENQKQRIAKELHDSVGVLLSTARLSLENNPNPHQLQFALQLVDKACKEVRTISHEMTPTLFQEIGLVRSLVDFQEIFSQNNTITLDLFVKGYTHELGIEKELVLYRVITEIVNNAIKHAACASISIQLMARESHLIVTIEDDGKGFDVYTTKSGLGLNSIKQRIILLGGIHTLESSIGKGTIHYIDLPL